MKFRKSVTGTAIILCVMFVVMGCSGEKKDYEKTVETLCTAKQEGDLDTFLSLFGPLKGLMASVVTEEVFQEKIDNYKNTCGDDYKLSYKITKDTRVDDDKLTDLEDTLTMSGGESKVTEAYELEVAVTAKGSKGDKDYTMAITVAKADDEWCIADFDSGVLE